MKRFFTTLLLLTLALASFAQRSKTREVTIPSIVDEISYPGTLKYEYTVNDEGYHVWNGAVTVNGTSEDNMNGTKVVSSFSLSSRFESGRLNGPLNIVNKVTVGRDSFTYTLSGAFSKGVPNGVFTISIDKNGDTRTESTTYFYGAIAGRTPWDIFKGTFDGNGKMTGTIKSEGGNEEEYVKGVQVFWTSADKDMPPEIEKLSRKYAAGSIDETELNRQGFVVAKGMIECDNGFWELAVSDGFACWPSLLGTEPATPDTFIEYLYIKENTIEELVEQIGDNLFTNLESYEVAEYKAEEVVEEEVEEESIPFQIVEKKPSFQGGDANAFSMWVAQNMIYPEAAKECNAQGKIITRFTISPDGSVTNVEIVRGSTIWSIGKKSLPKQTAF